MPAFYFYSRFVTDHGKDFHSLIKKNGIGAFGVCPFVDLSQPIEMNCKNAGFLYMDVSSKRI